jgi:two-component system LytT family response regulator
MRIRVLIADDEPHARALVAAVLFHEPDVAVIGQCENGREAADAINKLAPDLVYLDVQMPGLDGFGVLDALPQEHRPLIVFITAHEQYAVRAFGKHAFDYLLKPFEYARLRETVQRARAHLTARGAAARAAAMSEDGREMTQAWNRLALREVGRVVFIKPEEIDWAETEGNYVRFHAGKKSYLLRETMNSTESRLAAKNFLRISRTHLVNLERIREWHPLFHGDSILILHDGTKFTVTRVYRKKFDQIVHQLD